MSSGEEFNEDDFKFNENDDYVFNDPERYAINYITAVENEWKKNSFCDLTLIAKKDGTRVKAHRFILSANNSYFKEKLSLNSTEGEDNKIIEIEDISGDELKTLINYTYTGIIEINSLNVGPLLRTASSLNYTSIVEKCEDFYLKKLQPGECFGLTSFAKSQHTFSKRLSEAIKSYQKEHFSDIIQFDEYLYLSGEEVYELFANHEPRDSKLEKRAFKAALRWVKHDRKNREDFLPKLLNSINLHFLDEEYLEKEVLKAVVDKSEECTQIVKEAIKNRIVETGKKLVIAYKDIYIYCFDKKSVEKNMVHDDGLRADGSTVLVKDKLYCVGQGLQSDHGFWSLDLKTGVFADLEPTLKSRFHCGVVELNGDIYAISGFDELSVRSVEKFDTKTKKWKLVKKLLQETIGHACAALNGEIFVAGGRESTYVMSTVQSFNPKTNSWSFCKRMLHERAFFAMVAKDNCLFAIGGKGRRLQLLKSIEKYDSKVNWWTEVSQLTNEYKEISACLVENRIIIVGGSESNEKLAMEEFNPETYECKFIGYLPIKCKNLNNLFVHFYNQNEQ